MKKIKSKKLFSLLMAVVMILQVLLITPTYAADDTRKPISNIVATSNIENIPVYGKEVKDPTFNVTEGAPARFAVSSTGYWSKKDGTKWKSYNGETFIEGTYKYEVQIRVDGDAGKTHVLDSKGVTATVDGNKWAENKTPITADMDSYIYITSSKEYIIEAPLGAPLNFVKDKSWNILLNYKGKAIKSFSVAGGVTGGEKPYTFSKVSGPDWINVANDGTVTGTPNSAGKNSDLVICVTDNNSATKEITISVADTLVDPSDRTKISNIVATSDIDTILTHGGIVKDPTFTVIEGAPARFAVSTTGYWSKKDGTKWNVYKGETFTEGIYKYEVQIRVDGDAGKTHVLDSKGVTATVDGDKWAENKTPITDDTFSYIYISSKEYEISKTAEEKVTITFNENGHGKAPSPITVNKGTVAKKPADPTDTENDFGGWYKEATCENEFDFTQAVNASITLYAKWTAKTPPAPETVTIKFDANGHGTAPEDITVNKGEKATAPADPTDTENDFGGWYTEAACKNKFDFTQAVNASITLYAKWTAKTPPAVETAHDVNIIPTTNGKVTPDKTKAKKGDTVTLTITPDAGYVVDEISVMDDGASNVPVKDNKFIMPDMLVNVTVTFKPIVTPPTPADHSITINPTTNGTVKADKEKAKKGDTVTLTINPTAGYELKEIKVMAGTDIITVTGNTFTMPDADVTVTVTFKEKTGTPPTPPTPTPDTYTPPYTPDYYDYYDYYHYHRPYRPSRPAEEKKTEEKPIDKPAKKVETEVILTIGSNNLDNRINGVDSFKGMDVAPYIKNGRTMLPIRYVAEALGMSVSWDAKTRTVIIGDMFYTVEIPVDTNKIIVNGDVFTSDVKPEIVHGRTMMPVANIARALGLKDGKDIIWDASMRQVIIKRVYDK